MQKISPFLWFDTQAEAAANLYVSLFPNSKITEVSRYPEGSPMPAGSVMSITFELEGQEFMALNAGPQYKFTEAISFFVKCENQDEVDHYWNALVASGGEEQPCGWLKDRFGVSWQIIPNRLMELMSDPDPARAQAAMQAMLQMQKIIINDLETAADGVAVS